jgi:SPP1 family holin
MNLDKASIARLIVFILAWVNNFLVSKGLKTLPIIDESTIAMILTLLISAYTFYKHNFLGKKAKEVEQAVVKEAEVVIEKVIETKQPTPQPVQKVKVTNVPQAPVNTVTPEITVAPQPPVETKTENK